MIEVNIKQKKYGDTFSIDDVSFDIRQGKVTLLVGHNGSGKTTIIKSLLGITELDEGKVIFDEEEMSFVDKEDVDYFKSNVAYIQDEDHLFDFLTPNEYFDLVALTRGNVKINYLNTLKKIFGIEEYENKLIKALSYGNRKKVQIISQLLWEPRYVIIDEPTNGLDPDMIIILQKIIKKLKSNNVGFLLSTHNLKFGESLMDDVHIIRNGKEMLGTTKEKLISRFGHEDMERIYLKVNERYYRDIEELIQDGMVANN